MKTGRPPSARSRTQAAERMQRVFQDAENSSGVSLSQNPPAATRWSAGSRQKIEG